MGPWDVCLQDLLAVPPLWLDRHQAGQALKDIAPRLHVPTLQGCRLLRLAEPPAFAEALDMVEVYCGSAHLSQACLAVGMRVGPLFDVSPHIWPPGAAHRPTQGVLSTSGSPRPPGVVGCAGGGCAPYWVHVDLPCTFWTPMAHWSTRRADVRLALEALLHVRFSMQAFDWQCRRSKRVGSFEQPPRCRTPCSCHACPCCHLRL